MTDSDAAGAAPRRTETGGTGRLDFTAPGAAPGDAQRLTREYLDSLLLEMRVIDAVAASTETEFFNLRFRTPVMVTALSALDTVCPGGMALAAQGAAAAGALFMAGVGSAEELEAVCATGARVAKIIKPYRDHDIIFEKIAHAERCGAVAVGMDVSFGSGMKNGYAPAPVSPKTTADLRAFASATRLPFVVKGILGEADALKAADAGAAAVMVSHQGGTVLDYAVPPPQILPRIVRALEGRIPVFADCCVASGMDAFKLLALGARGAGAGRAVMAGLAQNGAAGVQAVLEKMTAELARTMSLTGCPVPGGITADVLWHRRDAGRED